VDEEVETVECLVTVASTPIIRHYYSIGDPPLFENTETGQWSTRIELEDVDKWALSDIGSLSDVIAHLQKQLDSVPVQYRDNVKFCISDDYEAETFDIKAYYDRPATEEEIFKYKNLRQIDRQRQEAAERKEYERLKIKFARD
jgi:hypothetical protein